MKRYAIVVVVLLSFVTWSTPTFVQAQSVDIESAYRETLLQLINLLQKQILDLQAELDLSLLAESTEDTFVNISSSVEIVVNYSVKGFSSVEAIPDRQQREYFTRVFELFPSEYDSKLVQLLVFTDADFKVDAFVETVPPDHTEWMFAVSEDILGEVDSDYNAELIVHELAHIVSYQEVEGVSRSEESSCSDYFKIQGCPLENSYLKLFYDKFWSEEDIERIDLYSEEEYPQQSAYEYYKKHKTEYVSNYAATAPEEDFSESFTYYMLGMSAEGRVLNRKIDFFKDYPEMSEIKRSVTQAK